MVFSSFTRPGILGFSGPRSQGSFCASGDMLGFCAGKVAGLKIGEIGISGICKTHWFPPLYIYNYIYMYIYIYIVHIYILCIYIYYVYIYIYIYILCIYIMYICIYIYNVYMYIYIYIMYIYIYYVYIYTLWKFRIAIWKMNMIKIFRYVYLSYKWAMAYRRVPNQRARPASAVHPRQLHSQTPPVRLGIG